jgi:hypothetical protein
MIGLTVSWVGVMMNPLDRDYQKLKTLGDFRQLDPPTEINLVSPPPCPYDSQMILRMLVRPKYGVWRIPAELKWLEETIVTLAMLDRTITGIKDSWCYVTVRHGPVSTKTDDEWHFDGASFRTTLIPERNYIWVDHTPMQYKVGEVVFPPDFDPCRHNLFPYASSALEGQPIQTGEAKRWYLINPFCLHRRDPSATGQRTFIRISFPDIEGRDISNTSNSLLDTPAWGRDPVRDFRDNLHTYRGA